MWKDVVCYIFIEGCFLSKYFSVLSHIFYIKAKPFCQVCKKVNNKLVQFNTRFLPPQLTSKSILSSTCLLHSKLEVIMPKFKMEQSYSLHKLLPEMGMESIFSNLANLTKLSHHEGLKVSEVSFQFNHTIKTHLCIPAIADHYFLYLSLKNPRCYTRLLLRWMRWGPLLQLPQQLALHHFLSPESSWSTDRSSSLYTMKTLTVCCSWAG